MVKIPRKAYTLEFKQEAVRLVEPASRFRRQRAALGLSDWVKAHRACKLRGAGTRGELTAEQINFSYLELSCRGFRRRTRKLKGSRCHASTRTRVALSLTHRRRLPKPWL